MLLRAMRLSDLDNIMPLERQLFSSPWSKDDYIYELSSNPYAKYYVLEDDKIVGYVGIWITYETAQITTIGIAKERQGEGLSKLLMNKVIEETKDCEAITLEVRVSNVKAIKLYESYGFKKEAIRKDYYLDNHEDAYLMMKERKI
ncbi:ribosomal protein S18-alanine N-acetyltransferase [Sharpea azabuensis]|uniref:ribosomal protein S18-alanine N-acetyltransferase n=2 Tax=Sharpea azabuensis TaxID=322505 RepID=UPI000E9FE56B|nr:ribosomal protein S18-alanine N-acetyltransferase [Sharpea azabuensis]HAJ15172.1 ribosomal-protein-alanine N-acetyltransferase [Erysipelotrichaceae bacterium]HAV18544.1 ribosomal-protein-alanine N-acetyltransferase [Erysipelotrichaceae bacterium]HBG85276.1 ribosomal-protein-alanine N-acetyltransferase [Erysipelotrichaceae bacterium]HBZ51741.1 ribosomal-protein-alanine N-acetyltransferase [Erysipelotrichaceae bacterium]HCJ13724.1 ribosomal-protein-alanine N-acetyltransferase [Erysipelotricha